MSSEHKTSAYSWVALGLLIAVYIMNQWDRFLFNYMCAVSPASNCTKLLNSFPDHKSSSFEKPTCPADLYTCKSDECAELQQCYDDHDFAKHQLCYSDCLGQQEYSVLGSYGFTALFSVAGLFAGRLSDVTNRRNVIMVSLLCWSACVVAQGFTTGYGGVLASRLGLGFFAAFSNPAAYSLIADYFPPLSRGRANGLYAFGVYVGGGLSSLSIVIAQAAGWKFTSFLCGGLGGALAVLLLLFLREPARGKFKAPLKISRRSVETTVRRTTGRAASTKTSRRRWAL